MKKEELKPLMLYRNDFKNKRDWIAICDALGVSMDTVEIELKCVPIVAKENYSHNNDIKVARELEE